MPRRFGYTTYMKTTVTIDSTGRTFTMTKGWKCFPNWGTFLFVPSMKQPLPSLT